MGGLLVRFEWGLGWDSVTLGGLVYTSSSVIGQLWEMSSLKG